MLLSIVSPYLPGLTWNMSEPLRDLSAVAWDRRMAALATVSVIALVGVWAYGPVPQWQDYHRFADLRAAFGIANASNVLTNLAFLGVGCYGLATCWRGPPTGALPELLACYRSYFAGTALVALGSAYYHLAPDDARLVWDRLPMTIGFMALICVVIGEQVDRRLGRRMLWPALITGVASVFYWSWTESQGAGDLRAYALVQFLPLLLIPMMLAMYRSPFGTVRHYLWLIGLYLLAKFTEFGDAALLAWIGISGHSLKHLLAAAAAAAMIVALRRRRMAT